MSAERVINVTLTSTDKTADGFNSAKRAAQEFHQAVNTGSQQATKSFQGIGEGAASAVGNVDALKKSFSEMVSSATTAADPLKLALSSIEVQVQSIASTLATLSGSFGVLVGAVAVTESLSAATNFLTKSLRDAGQETTNLIQLSATWKSTNRGSNEEMVKMVESVKDLARSSTYASQEVIGAMKYLAGLPQITNENLMKTMQTVIDFASYSSRDLMSSANTMRMAATGMYGELAYSGVVLSQATRASKDFNQVLDEMSSKFSGQEVAKLETYEGAVGGLEKAFNRVQKVVGHIIEPALVSVLKDLISYFKEFGEAMEGAQKQGEYAAITEQLRKAFEGVGEGVKKTVAGIVEWAGQEGNISRLIESFKSMIHTVHQIGAAIAYVAKIFVEHFETIKIAAAVIIGYKVAMWLFHSAIRAVTSAQEAWSIFTKEGTTSLLKHILSVKDHTAVTRENTAAIRENTAAKKENAVVPGPQEAPRVPKETKTPPKPGETKKTASAGVASFIAGVTGFTAGMSVGAVIADWLKIDGTAKTAIEVGTGMVGTSILAGMTNYLMTSGKVLLAKVFGDLVLGAAASVALAGTAIAATVATPLAVTMGYLYKKNKEQAEKWKDEQKKAALEEEGLGVDIAKMERTAEGAKRAFDFFGEGSKEAEDAAVSMATEFAKSGMSFESFSKQFEEEIGKKLPDTAKKAFEDTKKEVDKFSSKDFDFTKFRKEKLTESYVQQFEVGKGVGETAGQTRAKEVAVLSEELKKGKITQLQYQISMEALDKAMGVFVNSVKKTRDELEKVGKFDASGFKAAAAEINRTTFEGLDDKVVAQRAKAAEQEIKSYYSHIKAADEAAYASAKANINETTQSRILASQRIAAMEVERSRRTIDLANQENAAVIALINKEIDARMEIALRTAGPEEDKAKVRAQFEDERLQKTRQAQEAQTKIIEQELNKQIQAYEQHANRIRDLQNQLYEIDKSGRESQKTLFQATQTEQQKVQTQLADMRSKYQEAVNLMPTMPERALALFKEVQNIATGLGQPIANLKQQLKDFGEQSMNTIRSIEKIGKSPFQAWHMDVQKLNAQLQEAQTLLAKGEFAKAKEKAMAAMQTAQQVAQGAQGVGKEEAKRVGMQAAVAAQSIGQQALQKDLESKERIQREAEVTAKAATDQQKAIVSDQISVEQQQIDVVREEIKALQELTQVLRAAQVQELKKTVAGETTPEAKAEAQQRLSAIEASIGATGGRTGEQGVTAATALGTGEATRSTLYGGVSQEEALQNFEGGLTSLASSVAGSYGKMFDKVDIMAGFGDGLAEAFSKIVPSGEPEYSEETKRFQASQQKAEAEKTYMETMKEATERIKEAGDAFIEAMRQKINVELKVNAAGSLTEVST